AQCLHIVPDQSPPLRRLLDQDADRGTARQRFDSERAGAGEKIKHAPAIELRRIAVRNDVEDSLAGPVRRRTNGACTRRLQRTTSKFASDDAHLFFPRSFSGTAGRACAGPSPAGRSPARSLRSFGSTSPLARTL